MRLHINDWQDGAIVSVDRQVVQVSFDRGPYEPFHIREVSAGSTVRFILEREPEEVGYPEVREEPPILGYSTPPWLVPGNIIRRGAEGQRELIEELFAIVPDAAPLVRLRNLESDEEVCVVETADKLLTGPVWFTGETYHTDGRAAIRDAAEHIFQTLAQTLGGALQNMAASLLSVAAPASASESTSSRSIWERLRDENPYTE